MSRDPRLYLEDIRASCEKVLRFSTGLSYAEFTQDELYYDAILCNLEIIGEATKKIPEAIRGNYPEIEWR